MRSGRYKRLMCAVPVAVALLTAPACAQEAPAPTPMACFPLPTTRDPAAAPPLPLLVTHCPAPPADVPRAGTDPVLRLPPPPPLCATTIQVVTPEVLTLGITVLESGINHHTLEALLALFAGR